MIEPARRHGHSDPRFSPRYFAQFSASSRAGHAAHRDATASTAVDGWEDEGGASPTQARLPEPVGAR
jgi:hypothetical protein